MTKSFYPAAVSELMRKRFIAKRVGIIWLLLILTATAGHSQQKETVSAEQILERMFSVYASCTSYMDKGRVRENHLERNRIVIKPFATAFVRPSRFRFEFTEDSDMKSQSYVVWRDGVSIRSWWSVKPQTRYHETLGHAVWGATGVSGTSAIVVPSMLFQNIGDYRRVQSLTDLSLVREEKVGGRAAYRIQGRDWMNIRLTLWIDKKTFLLVKLFEKRTERADVELTINYEPQINVDVPAEKLAFKH